MIRSVAGILVRALVEIGLVLFVLAAMFLVLAFRIARRFVTDTPDPLERLAGPLATGLGFIASRSRRAAGALEEWDDEYDEDDEAEPEPDVHALDSSRSIASDEWKGLVV